MLIRNANDRALTREQLPVSVFATHPSPETSQRYRFVDTAHILDTLDENGFYPVYATQNGTRKRPKEFAKHMVVFRSHAHEARKEIGELIPEVIITNSHNGTSAYAIHAGLFRLVCLNGAVVADTTFSDVRIRHNAKSLDNVIEGVYSVVEQAQTYASKCLDWQGLTMNALERIEFAKEAKDLRWGTDHDFDPVKLLHARRQEDASNDLYHVFQRVQENITQRGVARAIRGIDSNIHLNQQLFALTSEWATRLQ